MKYLLFMFVVVLAIAVWTQNIPNLDILLDFFMGGFIGYCAARFLSD